MILGDLVRYRDTVRVVSCYVRPLKVFVAQGWNGTEVEIPEELPVEILGNPGHTWPFITHSSGNGQVIALTCPKRGVLTPLVDWLPTNLNGPTTAIYLSPRLRLMPGEILRATYKRGNQGTITIGRTFRTVSQKKKAMKKEPVAEVPTALRKLGDDF